MVRHLGSEFSRRLALTGRLTLILLLGRKERDPGLGELGVTLVDVLDQQVDRRMGAKDSMGFRLVTWSKRSGDTPRSGRANARAYETSTSRTPFLTRHASTYVRICSRTFSLSGMALIFIAGCETSDVCRRMFPKEKILSQIG
jgi:hypothetical protein